jgi:hypothetical protein
MQTENDTSKPETELKHEAGEGCPGATCSACGMLVGLHRNYHPHAACLMFRECHNGNTVDANLRAVVEYGMRAQAAGVSLEKAMDDIAWRNCLPNAIAVAPPTQDPTEAPR